MRADGHVIQRAFPSRLKFSAGMEAFSRKNDFSQVNSPAISGTFTLRGLPYFARILSFK